jgi:hypothetical protein
MIVRKFHSSAFLEIAQTSFGRHRTIDFASKDSATWTVDVKKIIFLFSVYIHAIDQLSNDTDVPDLTSFALPADAVVVLRCIALGLSVDEDRRARAAKMLVRFCGNSKSEPSSDDLRKMLTEKVNDISTLPPHILLNEKLWQPQPDKIRETSAVTVIDRSAFIWPLQIVDRETDEDEDEETDDGDVAGGTALVVSLAAVPIW